MNKLRRNLIKFSILQFVAFFIPFKSFAIRKNKNKYKTKELNGFTWYLDKKD